jgi:hypothetical protein
MKENSGLAFNGQGGAGYSTRPASTNHYTGKMNDGALINKGRGPTKGNQDYDAGQGKHREPPTAKLPSSTKIKNPDYINGGSQYRGVGGTTVKKPGASAKINVGRGPTKGNE